MTSSRFSIIQGAGLRAVRIYDEQNNHASVDRVAEALVLIDVNHQRVHQGVSYHVSFKFEAVANDASVNVLFQTDAAGGAHILAEQIAGGDADFLTFEGVTFSDQGTLLIPRNRNRFASDDSLATVTHTPTLIDDGTLLADVFIPGGTGGNAIGGSTGGALSPELVFVPDAIYMFRATNRAGTAQPLNIQLNWYEPSEVGLS